VRRRLAWPFPGHIAASPSRFSRGCCWLGLTVVFGLAVVGSAVASAGTLVAVDVEALDRVALAVDGAESSHGADAKMWRPEVDGPQGLMQVSAAAAMDVGNGDRFDPGENRALGRAWGWRRTALATKERHDSRVRVIAPLPSLIHCPAMPRRL
jgi:hypothetical protein